MKEGTLTGLTQEDIAYLAKMAQKYGLDMRGLVTTVIKSAGGWGDASNNLVLEGFWMAGPSAGAKSGKGNMPRVLL